MQYYRCSSDVSHNGQYLSKKDDELIRKHAQKTYDKRVLQKAKKRLAQINSFLKDYENDEVEKWFLCEHFERQKLIKPVEKSFQQKLSEWKNVPYSGKEFKEDNPVILTNNGLRVRSKSEKILADFFDQNKIPYKYECPLYLKPYGYVYPDFTFLSEKTGEEVYWEHDGRMDDPDYARNAIRKIQMYEENGIYPGEKLILTFETEKSVLDIRIVKKLVEKYLL